MINQRRFNCLFIFSVVCAIIGIIFGVAGLAYRTGYTNQWCKTVNCSCFTTTENNCTIGRDTRLLFFQTQTSLQTIYRSVQPICPGDYFNCFTLPVSSTVVELSLRDPPSSTLVALFEIAFLFCGVAIGCQVPSIILKFLLVEPGSESGPQEYTNLVANREDTLHNSL